MKLAHLRCFHRTEFGESMHARKLQLDAMRSVKAQMSMRHRRARGCFGRAAKKRHAGEEDASRNEVRAADC